MDLKLDPTRAALLVVDIQDRLAAAMPPDGRAQAERNVVILIEAARRLGMPIVASEQYPRGLGPTVQVLQETLAAASIRGPTVQVLQETLAAAEQAGATVRRFEKVEFAAPQAPAWEGIWSDLRREQWIVTGMETHVCVYQSVRDLVARGAVVHTPVDAVTSRTPENKGIGLTLIERAGGIVTSTETVVFDALQRAGTEDFRALSRLIK
jgi:nicotinamidase-related amidase